MNMLNGIFNVCGLCMFTCLCKCRSVCLCRFVVCVSAGMCVLMSKGLRVLSPIFVSASAAVRVCMFVRGS